MRPGVGGAHLGQEVHGQPLGEVTGQHVGVLQHLPGRRTFLGVLGQAVSGEGVEGRTPPGAERKQWLELYQLL